MIRSNLLSFDEMRGAQDNYKDHHTGKYWGEVDPVVPVIETIAWREYVRQMEDLGYKVEFGKQTNTGSGNFADQRSVFPKE